MNRSQDYCYERERERERVYKFFIIIIIIIRYCVDEAIASAVRQTFTGQYTMEHVCVCVCEFMYNSHTHNNYYTVI